jgi:CarD family transcriptional regulator
MFQVGEAVVHPSHGPGKVADIERLLCFGKDRRYYKIKVLGEAEMIVWVPVQEAEDKGVRCPVPKSRLSEIWQRLRAEPETLPSDHQKRYEYLREKIENGDVLQIAEALRDLCWKDHHVRKLTINGKRLYDKGIELLSAEMALVQGSDPEVVEDQLLRVLSENVASREAV